PPLTPPHKGEGKSETLALGIRTPVDGATPTSPSPLWGGVRGGGTFPPCPKFATVKSPISLPSSFSIGASAMRPGAGSLQASIRSSQSPALSPVTRYLAKLEISIRPTRLRTACTSAATCSKSVERRHENSSLAPCGAYQSGTSS